MYYYVKGELTERDVNTCVVECGGVGYSLTVSMITSEALASRLGQVVKLYTHLAVREDGVELFGFGSVAERDTFNLLIGVSGVGPKAAINVLSVLTPERLAMAICTDDAKSISKAPNVGAKTAARIILELRDKVAKDMLPSSRTATLGSVGAVQHTVVRGALGEALEALTVLGYDRATAMAALKDADPNSTDVGALIKTALKALAK
ncbi:MAG: Holliday junction branch migration protein RuvA [Clostridia bacterium]|nr:Holliday junction branch migration protein RuvA [Clostridia bacterium]